MNGVIFDLDGTLCDTIRDLADAVNYALKTNGYKTWTTDEVRAKVGNGITKLIERSLPENERSDERVTFVRGYFMEYYSTHLLDHTVPYDGISELLRTLRKKRIPVAVVTNKSHEQSCVIIKTLFPDIDFAAVLGHKDGIPHKPDITLTNKALSYMGADAHGSVFVGDSGVDIRTAHNAGMTGIGVTWGYRSIEDLAEADIIVSDAYKLKEAILNRGIN